MRGKAYTFHGIKDSGIKDPSGAMFLDNLYLKSNDGRRDSGYSDVKNRKVLDKKSFQHKKHLGQNFLHDELILGQIIQSIPSNIVPFITSGQIRLIEVGIGLGDLTKFLLDKYPVLAYEVDDDLLARAEHVFSMYLENKHLVLEKQDVLKACKGDGYLFDSPYFLVSNLPYYIATAIILRALKDEYCKGFLVMTQREVAQKFCAKHKDSNFCSLSILAQSFGQVEYLFDVAPSAFNPPPKVHSAVFCFQRGERYYTKDLEEMLHYAFLAPRKKLLSNLMKCKGNFTKTRMEEVFMELDLSLEIRAHEVSLQEYCKIVQFLKRMKNE